MRLIKIVAIGFGLSCTAHAMALQVLSTQGDSLSAQPYYQALQTSSQSVTQPTSVPSPYKPLGDIRFPVHSSLTPGDVATTTVPVHRLTRPFFVMGDDKRSLDWLLTNQDRLKKMHALGVVTNIDNAAAFEKLQQQVDLPLIPASLDDLSRVIPVTHYPFLMNDGVITQ